MRITLDLLRKRSEHNDGILADLEEVSLHQQEIEVMENLHLCRHLKILYLQNNIINKIENVSKLKELEYLNLALNNVALIENLEGCESLKKLDLTVNFITLENLEESVRNLRANCELEQLYLVGNPCADWPGCRDYVIANLSSLRSLDGTDVKPSDRIKARRRLDDLEEELERLVDENKTKEAKKTPEEKERERKAAAEGSAYTRESRTQMYREMAQEREEKEKARNPQKDEKPKELPSVFLKDGKIRQCNEGKWRFTIDEGSESGCVTVELFLPKYMDTSFIEVDVQPLYFRAVVKGKVTQMRLPAEVSPDRSKVQRSKVTGSLKLTMPLACAPEGNDLKGKKGIQMETEASVQKDRDEAGKDSGGKAGTRLTGSVSLHITCERKEKERRERAEFDRALRERVSRRTAQKGKDRDNAVTTEAATANKEPVEGPEDMPALESVY
mmetsp:Transcript_29475/g.57846  ORF Transcript_29475/g.57846 Transcript_29475/m.57846 type:complete len:444 (-) Transcript_29475:58-1389(-)